MDDLTTQKCNQSARPIAIVADTHATARASVQEALARRGFAVETASDGPALLRKLDALTEAPVCLILDSDLPGLEMSTFETRERLDRLADAAVFISGQSLGPFPSALRLARRWHRSPWMLTYLVRQVEAALPRGAALHRAA